MRLSSWVGGRWVEGSGPVQVLYNPATEEAIAEVGAEGVDRGTALDHARQVGGPALRAMTFAERGAVLGAMSRAIQGAREELIEIAVRNGGNTRSDAKFDLDGATFTLSTYADIGASLGDARVLVDGEGVALARSPRFHGQHLRVPRAGVAVHINAFNFPAWGLAEKAAVALLAGMPVLAKPATSSALLAHRLMQVLLEAGVVPDGALSLLVAPAGDLLDHLGPQDVVAFTGSSDTGRAIRGNAAVIAHSVRVNVEADSLNAAVLGPDVEEGSETWSLFLRDVARDVTQKAGQKCTAIRRVLVPPARLAAVREDLAARLSSTVVGNPAHEGVRMGPVASAAQRRDVREGIARLAADGRIVAGSLDAVTPVGCPEGKGFFVAPVLLEVEEGAAAPNVHGHEVFGPVATLVPYSGTASDAAALVARGGGGLVTSVYSDEQGFTTDAVLGLAPYHGRLFLGSAKIAEMSPGPGTVLPHLIHGGPGRAGGGEELGGLRGLDFYSQRVALEGSRPVIERITGTKA